QETLKSVPLVDQNDLRRNVESALHERAEQIRQGTPPPERSPAPAQKAPDQGPTPAYLNPDKSPFEPVQSLASHLYNNMLSAVSGEDPKQIAAKLDPQVAVTINSGREVKAQLDNGRSFQSLNPQEKRDFEAYNKFQETLKNVPAFEQAALKADVEAA